MDFGSSTHRRPKLDTVNNYAVRLINATDKEAEAELIARELIHEIAEINRRALERRRYNERYGNRIPGILRGGVARNSSNLGRRQMTGFLQNIADELLKLIPQAQNKEYLRLIEIIRKRIRR